jgi:hypothetical protein
MLTLTTGTGRLSPSKFSPEGEAAPDTYRNHVAIIDELEKKNRRFAKEATGTAKRWQKAKEKLADLQKPKMLMATLVVAETGAIPAVRWSV